MKPYYVMIRFGGPYVTGFIIPQAKNELHAIKQVKAMVWVQMNTEGAKKRHEGNEFNVTRLKELMRSLKRPWRLAGNFRKNSLIQCVVSKDPVVKVLEMTIPVYSNYWLVDMSSLSHLCNQPAWTTPRKSI